MNLVYGLRPTFFVVLIVGALEMTRSLSWRAVSNCPILVLKITSTKIVMALQCHINRNHKFIVTAILRNVVSGRASLNFRHSAVESVNTSPISMAYQPPRRAAHSYPLSSELSSRGAKPLVLSLSKDVAISPAEERSLGIEIATPASSAGSQSRFW